MGDIPIVYEDNHVLVVVKPANVPTQADASGDVDLLSLMKQSVRERYNKPGEVYLGLVHRLDRPVGGLIVFARTSKAAARLSAQAREKALQREYFAVVRGEALPEVRLVDTLFKDERTNTVHVVPEGTMGAKQAALTYRCLAQTDGLSLVQVTLETGRSHQIRVQLTHAGLPLWGDARYGNGQPGQQIALWAGRLAFEHPTLKERMTFQSLPNATLPPWRAFHNMLSELEAERS